MQTDIALLYYFNSIEIMRKIQAKKPNNYIYKFKILSETKNVLFLQWFNFLKFTIQFLTDKRGLKLRSTLQYRL